MQNNSLLLVKLITWTYRERGHISMNVGMETRDTIETGDQERELTRVL